MPHRSPDEGQEATEALPGQVGLADPALPIELPEGFIDASVFREDRPGGGQPQGSEALTQCAALGTVEVEEGPVEVEENGAGAKQGGVTSLGR
jgi:hypothetical protein